MDLLLDTQILVWVASGDPRLKRAIRDRLTAQDARLFVSAVTAFEFVELDRRGRFPPIVSFDAICRALAVQLLDYPSECWRLVDALPQLHRDPVDRMLVAHAMHADLTLVSADKIVRDYPVRCLW